MRISPWTLPLALTCLPTLGHAEAPPRKVDLGVFAGAHLFDHDNELGVDDLLVARGPDDSVGLGVRVGVWIRRALAIEAEVAVMPTQQVGDRVNVVAWRAHARLDLAHLGRQGALTPFAVAGLGATTLFGFAPSLPPRDTDPVTHAGVGLEWRVASAWSLRADARLMLPPSSQSSGVTVDGELWLGASLHVPRPARAPAPAASSDPGPTPPVVDDPPALVPTVGDRDGDGVPDDRDAAPDEPEDRDGVADDDGAPDLDNDGDGVADTQDGCRDQAEVQNGFQDADGCPDEVPAELAAFTGVLRGVTFDNNRATLRPSSFAVLNRGVATLKQFPALRIEVSGHTDNRGKKAKNQRLSEQRAAAVKAYFVAQGIDGTRIDTLGVGPDKPVASNKSSKGRAENRRIEIRLLP